VADDPTFFLPTIEPFMAVWRKLRLSGVAVRKDDKWISLSTRIALSHAEPESELLVAPTDDFIGFISDAPLSALEELTKAICTTGRYKIRVGDRDLEIFVTLAYATSDPSARNILLGPPFSTIGEVHERSFEIGDSSFRLLNSNVEHQYQIVDYGKLSGISSKLRLHKPAFNGVPELLAYLKAPFDKNHNQASVEIVAPLPFSMNCSDTEVTVTAPQASRGALRVIGFFDTGEPAVQLSEIKESDVAAVAVITGSIPWPKGSRTGRLFLYFKNHEVGSVSVHRWTGTTNWRMQVQAYFDPGGAILKRGLKARKEQTDLELATVRLLNELRVPAMWYGDRQFQDRSDLAACLEVKNERIVILGECTVQKPSVKFTPLLTRKTELEKLLQGEVRILSVVFTSSTLSSADKEQARQDGIALLGAAELAALLNGQEQEWGPPQVVSFLDSLLTEPLFDFPIRWQS
jgi:hypothetical protein